MSLALLLALVLGALTASPSALASTQARYRVQRLCSTQRAGSAACLGMKLVTASLTPAELHADALRQARETAATARPAVEQTTPFAGYQTPQTLHEAYVLPNETAAGATQTVAVVDAFDDPTAEADLGVFDKQFGLPPCTSANGCFRKVNENGNASPLPAVEGEWAGEISIDVQMAHSICQDCHVLLVEAKSQEFSDLATAVNSAVGAGATEISNSYAGPEEAADGSFAPSYDHSGVVVTAASGDCGYLNEACQWGQAANFPADSPDVVAVGGTKLTRGTTGVWKSTVWRDGGSGCSTLFEAPLWQSEVANFSATGCGAGRSVADVAALGDPSTGVNVYDSTPEGNGDPTGWGVWGGTSVASPIIAAEFALAGGSHGVAFPAATLYRHIGEREDLDDVVSGNNGSGCGGSTECQAAAGYDGPTGVGSPVGLGAFSDEGSASRPPTLTGLTPSSGITGSKVIIEGTELGEAEEVQLDYLPAKFKVLSSTRIEATVPNGARVGKATVTTPAGSVIGRQRFTPTLSITAFGPNSGPPGKVVKVRGVGFTSSSTVSFAGIQAQNVTFVSSKELLAVVPASAGTGPITVTNSVAPVGTVSSAAGYTP